MMEFHDNMPRELFNKELLQLKDASHLVVIYRMDYGETCGLVRTLNDEELLMTATMFARSTLLNDFYTKAILTATELRENSY
ncbi:hypothetical protein FW778_12840 [Ginsengibacter hankyongi]|uniref:Uncharacterized protein n=1 Tax=Ginsengibacter hankyongi TaxID=2607284 RepID=A0A5J5IGW3_9BACT|nr:hypothetical protein FW778_12840 [Ginsengibacter hankyongi]